MASHPTSTMAIKMKTVIQSRPPVSKDSLVRYRGIGLCYRYEVSIYHPVFQVLPALFSFREQIPFYHQAGNRRSPLGTKAGVFNHYSDGNFRVIFRGKGKKDGVVFS